MDNESRGIEPGETAEHHEGSATGRSVTDRAASTAFESAGEEKHFDDGRQSSGTAAGFTGKISISKEELRAVPDAALRAPARVVQVRPMEAPRTSGKAIAALVFGLLGIPLMGILIGPFAIIFGGWAMYEIGHSNHLAGKHLARSGIFLGILDIILWAAIFLFFLIRSRMQFAPLTGMMLFPG